MWGKRSNSLLFGVFLVFNALSQGVQGVEKLSFNEGLAAKREEKSGRIVYGFVDEKGKFVIKPEYDSIISGFREGFAIASVNKRVGVIDKNGTVVVPFEYVDIVRPFSNKLIPVKNKSGLWGFYSHSGKQISSCEYDNFRFRDKGKVIVQKHGMWGVIDSKGETLVAHDFRELEIAPDHKNYRAVRYNQWNLVDEKNAKLKEFRFDSLEPAGVGLLKYHMLGKYGLMDLEGKHITDYDFDSIGTEQYGRFAVKVWDKYGVIDRNGKEILPVKFDKVIIDSLGARAAIKSKEGELWWGLYAADGKQILPPAYHFLGEQGDSLIPVMAENGLWRYVDFSANTVIPYRFTEVSAFKHGVAEVKDHMSESKVVIDEQGKVVIPASEFDLYKAGLVWLGRNNTKIWKISRENYDELQVLDDEYIRVKKNGKYGLLNIDDKLLIPCKYDYVSEPSEEGYVIVNSGKKWGVIDKTGKFSFNPTERFEKIFDFHNGFAKVMEKGKYGFIDHRGNVYISPQYPDAGYVSEGMVAVKINSKWGFVNTDEKLLIQPYYDLVWPFVNGTAVVFSKGKYNLVNKQGKEIHEPVDKIKLTRSGKYLLINEGKYGLASPSGEEILPVKYDLIKEVKGDYLIVNLRGLYGVLDSNNNIIIPITYSSIKFDPFNNLFLCGSQKGFEQFSIDTKKGL